MTTPRICLSGPGGVLDISDGLYSELGYLEYEGLLNPTQVMRGAMEQTFDGPVRVKARRTSYPSRPITLSRIALIGGSGLAELYGRMAEVSAYLDGPGRLEVGSMYLDTVWDPPLNIKRVESTTRLEFSLTGEAIPGTWGAKYGYQVGRSQNILVRADRLDHAFLMPTTYLDSTYHRAFTLENPGTAPCDAVLVLSVASGDMAAAKTVYLRNTRQGANRPLAIAVNYVSAGVGYAFVPSAAHFTLMPGTNLIRIENGDGTLETQTDSGGTPVWTVGIYGTKFRWLGNSDDMFNESGAVLSHYRRGVANAVITAGTTPAAHVDMQPRIGCTRGTYDAAKAGLILEGSATNYLLNSDAPATQSVSLADGTYTCSMTGSGSVTLSGGPTDVVTVAAPATFTLSGGPTSVTFTCAGTVSTFDVQNLPFAASHISTAGASATRNADQAGVCALHNYLSYPRDLTQTSAWTVTGTGSPTVTRGGSCADGTIGNLWTIGDTDNRVVQSIIPDGAANDTPWTMVCTLRTPTTITSIDLRIEDQGSNLLGSAITVTAADVPANASRTYYASITAAQVGAATTGLKAVLQGKVGGSGSIVVEHCRLLRGSFPGPLDITETMTHPLPAEDWEWPSWITQNGYIQFKAVLPTISTGLTYYVFGDATFGLYRDTASTTGQTVLKLVKTADGGAQTVGNGTSTIATGNIWDGGLHTLKIEWVNYVLNNTQYMYLRLYVDGVLVSVDSNLVSATVTEWSAPERFLLSGGLAFVQMRDLTFGTA